MSSYEKYDQTSAAYDGGRTPVGMEILVGALTMSGRPAREMLVLDAGCGTGSYTKELLQFVGRVHAVDASSGMLNVATEKLSSELKEGRVALDRADLRELSFPESTFDGIVINQVLHHLDTPGFGRYPNHETVLRNLARFLKPGAPLVINTCAREQVTKGFWMTSLVPEAAKRLADRYMPIEDIEQILRASGLTCRGRFVPTDAVVGPSYFDGRGPLRKEWRDADSLWALASETELEAALARIRELDANGELDAFVANADRDRIHVGQLTFLVATRA